MNNIIFEPKDLEPTTTRIFIRNCKRCKNRFETEEEFSKVCVVCNKKKGRGARW